MKFRKNILCYSILILFFYFPNYFSQGDINLKLSEYSINQTLQAIVNSKAINFADLDGSYGLSTYNVNISSATVNLIGNNPNNVEINIGLSARATFNLLLFHFDINVSSSATVFGYAQLLPQGQGYKVVLKAQGIKNFSLTGTFLDLLIQDYVNGFIVKLPEISFASYTSLLPGVVAQYFTSSTPTLTVTNNDLILSLTMLAGPRYITVHNDVNQQVNIGNIQNEEGLNNYVSYPSPKTFTWTTGSVKKLQTPLDLLDASNGKNKYRNWLNSLNSVQSEIAARRIQITIGNQDGTYKAKFDLAKRIQLVNSLEGSFSGGTVTYESTTASIIDQYDYYSSTAQHSINSNVQTGTLGHNWSFWKWSDGNTNKSRNIILNNDLNLSAVYKATQVSNEATAYSNNSQRKFIQTKVNGTTWLHKVYSSMERIWLEHSSNGGITWFIGNGGQPINGNTIAKNPSIAFTYQDFGYGDENYYIGILWQEKNGSTYRIKSRMCTQMSGTDGIPTSFTSIITLYNETRENYYSDNANPNLVLTGGWGGPYLFTIEKKATSGSYPAGINWFVGYVQGGGGQVNGYFNPPTSHGIIGGTTSSTTSVQLSELDAQTISANFTYQQGTYTGGIYSGSLYFSYDGNNWTVTEYNDGLISYPSACFNPSIVTLPNYLYAVTWIEYEVLVYTRYYNSIISYFDTGVRSNSINSGGNTNSGFITWSKQNYSGTWYNKSMQVNNGTPMSGTISTLNTSGKYVQTGNGISADLSDMYVSSFYPLTTPYYFNTSGMLTPLLKDNIKLVAGRGFMIKKGETAFSYRFDDLNVDGKNISFVDAPDELDYGKAETLNNVLLTEPFQINANSKIVFSEKSGFVDSLVAVRSLGKDGFIKFKLDLLDEATGEVLAPVKSVNLNSANAYAERTPSYLLNAKGFAGKTVRIKITMESNLIEYTSPQLVSGDTTNLPDFIKERRNKKMSNLYLTKSFKEVNETVNKTEFNNLEVIEVDIPTTYAIEQNYPNPFNPSTTIKYQIPEEGFVTIKIYDVLGNEVKTLLNEDKNIGRYEVRFDASDLASGMYIYQLKVNSFTASKKMLLVK